jgi:hypothetical protein
MVWLAPGRSNLVRFVAIRKRCAFFPRLRTVKRSVEPAGADVRESVNEKSRAITRMSTAAVVAGDAEPASAATATSDRVAPTAERARRLPLTMEG